MKPRILIIAPLLDLPTVTSNMAVWDILDYASNRTNKIDFDLLSGLQAIRLIYDVKSYFKKYDLIIYYGHGKPSKLMGNHIWFSMIDARNSDTLKDKIISTMACYSGKRLGQIAIESGAKAYIGTITKYFAAFPETERNYLTDWIDYTTSKDKALIDGRTVGEAFRIFQKKGEHYLKIYENNIKFYNFEWYYNSLRSNLKNTILIGNKDAKVF